MQVVYSPLHLGHDVTTETFMGAPVPANEVAERAERIRSTLEADGGFARQAPTEHGDDADHRRPRPGPACGSSRWPGRESRAQAHRRGRS